MKLVPFLMTTKGLCVRCNKRRKMAIEKRYVNYEYEFSPHTREPWTVLDSGFQIPDTGFRPILCQWNWDSGF